MEFGQRTYGDRFFVPVKPHPIERPLSVDRGRHEDHSVPGNGAPATDGHARDDTPHQTDVPAHDHDTPTR